MGAWAWWCPAEEPFPADPSPELTAVMESALENNPEGVTAAEGPTETQIYSRGKYLKKGY